MKECSFLFCGVPNVSIRFYLTRYHPNIMYGQPRGGLQHRNIRTRNTTLKFSTCQGTLGNLFLRQSTSERVECARTTASQGFSGVGRRVGMGARDNPKVICFYIDFHHSGGLKSHCRKGEKTIKDGILIFILKGQQVTALTRRRLVAKRSLTHQ